MKTRHRRLKGEKRMCTDFKQLKRYNQAKIIILFGYLIYL